MGCILPYSYELIFQTHTTHRNIYVHENTQPQVYIDSCLHTHSRTHMHALKHNAIHTAVLRCLCSGDYVHFVPGTSQHSQLFSSAEISTGLSFTNVQTGFKEFNFVMGSTTCFQKFSQNCVFSLFLQNRCRHRKLAGFQII